VVYLLDVAIEEVRRRSILALRPRSNSPANRGKLSEAAQFNHASPLRAGERWIHGA